MRQDEYISGVSVPEVPCEQEVWTVDRTLVCRRLVLHPDLFSQEEIKGGSWARAAALGIAKDMLANGCVRVHFQQDYEDELWRVTYVARVASKQRQNIWKIGDLANAKAT